MNLPFSNSEALLNHAMVEELYEKLVLQLVKDFELANSYINLSADSSPTEVQKELHERVYVLLMEKFKTYLQLLYVIDVPEKAFKSLEVTDAVEVAQQVSFLILQRELQKVQLKARYSQK